MSDGEDVAAPAQANPNPPPLYTPSPLNPTRRPPASASRARKSRAWRRLPSPWRSPTRGILRARRRRTTTRCCALPCIARLCARHTCICFVHVTPQQVKRCEARIATLEADILRMQNKGAPGNDPVAKLRAEKDGIRGRLKAIYAEKDELQALIKGSHAAETPSITHNPPTRNPRRFLRRAPGCQRHGQAAVRRRRRRRAVQEP